MELTLLELAALVGGRLAPETDGAQLIRGAAAVGEAVEGEVTFFANSKYLAALRASRATAVLVPEGFDDSVRAVCLYVADPSAAFTIIAKRFAPELAPYEPGVHPTAVISSGVELGAGVSIQPYAVIEPGVRIGAGTVIGAYAFVGRGAAIGADCFLHPRVFIGARCLLADRVMVHSGAVVGSDGFGYQFQQGRHVKVPQIGIVQIDSDVEIGANTTIDRARFGRTWIQEGTKIDNLVQIAHNVVVGKHSILVAQVGIAGSCRLGNYVTLAGQVGLAGHLELGDQVTIGAQSGVNKTISAAGAYMGYPAVPAAEWREEVALIHRLKRLFSRVKQLEQAKNEQIPRSPEESSTLAS